MTAVGGLVWRCPRCQHPLQASPEETAGLACQNCGAYLEIRTFPALFEAAGDASPDAPVLTAEASCFFHPDRVAVHSCGRCGRFLCNFCRIDWAGQDLCTACLEASGNTAGADKLISSRFHFDSLALAISTFPLLGFFLSMFTAPVALGLTIFTFRRQCSIAPRSKYRFVLAGLFSLAEIAAWITLFVFAFRRDAHRL